MRVELVPLPHRPPLATSDTLQVPSNLAGSARAEPDRITPVARASAVRVFFSMSQCSPRSYDALWQTGRLIWRYMLPSLLIYRSVSHIEQGMLLRKERKTSIISYMNS